MVLRVVVDNGRPALGSDLPAREVGNPVRLRILRPALVAVIVVPRSVELLAVLVILDFEARSKGAATSDM